jgi:hypothetical protein
MKKDWIRVLWCACVALGLLAFLGTASAVESGAPCRDVTTLQSLPPPVPLNGPSRSCDALFQICEFDCSDSPNAIQCDCVCENQRCACERNQGIVGCLLRDCTGL